jgi:hypothetical protein
MKTFYTTTTETHADQVIREIFRIDPAALVNHRRDNRTVLHVRTARMSEFTLEAIAGVAHAYDLADIRRVAR